MSPSDSSISSRYPQQHIDAQVTTSQQHIDAQVTTSQQRIDVQKATSDNVEQPPFEELIEEYRVLQSEIQAYIQQRNTVLIAVVGAVGALLVFGFEKSPEAALLALYALLISAALLTWNGLYQATRRAAYIQVFIESKIPGLNWYTAMRTEGLVPFEVKVGRFRLQMNLVRVPHEYPIVYILLGLAGFIYALALWYERSTSLPLALSIGGLFILCAVVFALQVGNSAYGFRALANRWERQRMNMHNKGGAPCNEQKK